MAKKSKPETGQTPASAATATEQKTPESGLMARMYKEEQNQQRQEQQQLQQQQQQQ